MELRTYYVMHQHTPGEPLTRRGRFYSNLRSALRAAEKLVYGVVYEYGGRREVFLPLKTVSKVLGL